MVEAIRRAPENDFNDLVPGPQVRLKCIMHHFGYPLSPKHNQGTDTYTSLPSLYFVVTIMRDREAYSLRSAMVATRFPSFLLPLAAISHRAVLIF